MCVWRSYFLLFFSAPYLLYSALGLTVHVHVQVLPPKVMFEVSYLPWMMFAPAFTASPNVFTKSTFALACISSCVNRCFFLSTLITPPNNDFGWRPITSAPDKIDMSHVCECELEVTVKKRTCVL